MWEEIDLHEAAEHERQCGKKGCVVVLVDRMQIAMSTQPVHYVSVLFPGEHIGVLSFGALQQRHRVELNNSEDCLLAECLATPNSKIRLLNKNGALHVSSSRPAGLIATAWAFARNKLYRTPQVITINDERKTFRLLD